MMRAAILAALLVLVPAFADDGRDPVKYAMAKLNNGLWVYPDNAPRIDESRHFRFTMIPNEYTGSAQLEILIETPDGHSPEPVAFKFDYDGVQFPIDDYVYQAGNQYFVYLPDLQANKLVEFSLGLKNASFANYRVTALLTVDNGHKSAEWVGWKVRD